MTYLLDTATFLWAVTDPGKLSRRARRICESQRETLIVSVASLWEIMIKCASGDCGFSSLPSSCRSAS